MSMVINMFMYLSAVNNTLAALNDVNGLGQWIVHDRTTENVSCQYISVSSLTIAEREAEKSLCVSYLNHLLF